MSVCSLDSHDSWAMARLMARSRDSRHNDCGVVQQANATRSHRRHSLGWGVTSLFVLWVNKDKETKCFDSHDSWAMARLMGDGTTHDSGWTKTKKRLVNKDKETKCFWLQRTIFVYWCANLCDCLESTVGWRRPIGCLKTACVCVCVYIYVFTFLLIL